MFRNVFILLDGLNDRTKRIEKKLEKVLITMANLETALSDLTLAVNAAVDALGASTGPLQAALADAQSKIDAFTLQDVADADALAAAKADVQTALDSAQSAADAIEVQATALTNAVTPAAPVEPIPEPETPPAEGEPTA